LIEEEVSVEKNLIVRGVAFEDGITRVTIFGLENGFRNLPDIFTTLAEHHIDVDIIIQNQTADHKTYLSFSIKDKDLKETADLLEAGKEALSIDHFETETGLAKVSIIGSGMVSNPGVAAKMFQVLADHGIAIKMISTSEIKVSTVVDAKEMVRAARCLHEAFELDAVEQNI
ncbi:ACT domain-containing protein, partial [Heyndrickxia faecalis]